MPRSRKSLALALTLSLVAFFAAACSRVQTDQVAPSPTPTETPAPVAAPPSDPCAQWTEVARLGAGAFNGGAPELRVSIPKAAEAFSVFAQSAPAAVRDDAGLLAERWNAVAKEMRRVDYEPARLATDAQLRESVAAFGTAPARDAQSRIDSWSRANCSTPATQTPTARP